MIGNLASVVANTCGQVFGQARTVTFSRPHAISGDRGVTHALEVAAGAAMGATALSLRLPGGSAALGGDLPASLGVTIGGAKRYVSATARADAGVVAVVLSEGLAGAAVEGDTATLDTSIDVEVAGCLEQPAAFDIAGDSNTHAVQYELIVPFASAPTLPNGDTWAPLAGDRIVNASDHSPVAGTSVVVSTPMAGAGVWALQVGGG